jgi:hypothetical protein
MALLANVRSIIICLFLRINVPVISNPLPLDAGNQTYK